MKKEKIIIANWKMKLSVAETKALAKKIKNKFADFSGATIAVAPNYLSLLDVADALSNTKVLLSAQDVFWEMEGAYTGEISPLMLREVGCKYIIIGHSERRKYMMENYEMIHKKTKAVLGIEGMVPVVCIGENWEERKTERRDFVLFDQLQQALGGIKIGEEKMVVVAYEPIWAIGSGTSIEPGEAEYAHKVIKLTLSDMFGEDIVERNFRIIYGGSINGNNIGGFVNLKNIDGVLVGGASLDENDFYKVAKALLV